MEHSAYKELLSALFDGELHGAEREAALAHLETCADCRAYFAELAALRGALRDLEEYDAPEGFAAGVTARLRAGDEITRPRAGGATARPHAENAPETRKKRAPWRGAAALAACAAVALLTVHTLPNMLFLGGSGQSIRADSASNASGAAPAAAPRAPEAPQGAPAGSAADSGYSYVYTDGDGQSVGTLESARSEENGEAGVKMSAAHDGASAATEDRATGVGTYAAETADETAPIANEEDAPVAPLSGPEAWDEEYPVVTLSGEGAADWLAENGRQGESGAWYVEADALRALPETLTVLYSELPEGYDGSVLVELWEAEP